MDNVYKKTIRKIVFANVDKKSALMTDEAMVYPAASAHFAGHQTVNHSQYEYARGPAPTNHIEGYFSIFKHGMKGVYQLRSAKHLPGVWPNLTFGIPTESL